jgi:hypothetical protein
MPVVAANTALMPRQHEKLAQSIFGGKYEKQIEVAGQLVPLPNGEWLAIAHFPASTPGAVESAFLAQIKDARLVGAVIVQVSRPFQSEAPGFRRAQQCSRPGLLYVNVEANLDFGLQDCWTINHNMRGNWVQADSPPVIRAAIGELGVRSVTVPNVMLSVYFRLADKARFMHAVYYFDPEAEGIASSRATLWEESDWHRDYIGQYPEKMAYVRTLRDWGETWHPQVRERFQSRAATARAPAN